MSIVAHSTTSTNKAGRVEPSTPSGGIPLQQIAAEQNVSVKFLRSQIASGDLEAYKLGSRKPGTLKDTRPIRVTPAAYAAWLEPIQSAKA